MLLVIDEPVEPSAHSSAVLRAAGESSSSVLSIDTSVAGDVAGSPRPSLGSPKARGSDSHSQMRGFSKVSFRIKQLVSKEKRRFEEDGFNLDLTYVTSRLVAFGYPAESLEGIYRNHYKDVYNFFEQRHPERYRIYNLCTERSYDKEKFHNRVAEFRFDDHCPPPLALFLPFCQDVDAWLQEHPDNVAAIHCKAGKGRTGVMICAYLLYTGAWKTAEGAMQFFGAARSLKSQGVTIPSQRRFITYFGEMCHRARRMELDGDSASNDSDDDAGRLDEGREESSGCDDAKRERELSSADFKRLWEEALEGRGVTTKRQMFQCQPKVPATVYLKVVSIKLSGVYCQKKLDPRVYIECGRKSDQPPASYDLNGPFNSTSSSSTTTATSSPRAGSATPKANDAKELDNSSQDDSEPPPIGSASVPSSPSSRSSTTSACLDMELVLTDRCIVWDEVKVVLRNRNGSKIGHFWFHTAFVKRSVRGGRLKLTLAKVELDKVVKDIKQKHKKYAPTFGAALVFERATAEEIEAAEFAQRVAALKVDTSTTAAGAASIASRFSAPGSMSPGKMKAWANKRSDGAIYQFSSPKTSPSPPGSDDRVRANSDSLTQRRLDDAGLGRAHTPNGSAAVQLDGAKTKRIGDLEVFTKDDELTIETLDSVTRPAERASASPKAQSPSSSSSPKSSLVRFFTSRSTTSTTMTTTTTTAPRIDVNDDA